VALRNGLFSQYIATAGKIGSTVQIISFAGQNALQKQKRPATLIYKVTLFLNGSPV